MTRPTTYDSAVEQLRQRSELVCLDAEARALREHIAALERIHFSQDAHGLDVIEQGPAGPDHDCPRCRARTKAGEFAGGAA